MLLSCLQVVSVGLGHWSKYLLWRRNVFVLAVETVLSAKLAGPCFVAFLLACTTMVACLSSSNLLPSDLGLRRGRILADVGTLNVSNGLAVRLARRGWCMVGCLAMVRRADGGIVATGDAAVRTMIWVHRPRTRVVAMLHAWWWRLDVNELWRGGRLRSRGRAVSGDAVLSNTSCHRRGAGDAMRTLTRRRDVPRIRKGADVGRWKRR
jgi:hypothetical protein